MAIEEKRGCGYRKVGGLYLEGDYVPVGCDRLPYELTTCPACGHGLRFSRTPQRINPLHLFGYHQPCNDELRGCWLCHPRDEDSFIIWIGEQHYSTPSDFLNEGVHQGFSRRIKSVPRGFEVGKTVVFLAHNKAVTVNIPVAVQQALAIIDGDKQDRLLEAEQKEHHPGIFTAFIPQRIVKLMWESEVTDEVRDHYAKQGITVKSIPDGDKDHANTR